MGTFGLTNHQPAPDCFKQKKQPGYIWDAPADLLLPTKN